MAVTKPQARDTKKKTWISEAAWILANKDHAIICRLGRAIVASLKGDRRRREEETGKEVETIIGSDPPLHREDWHRLKGWYRAAIDRAPPPAWVTLERIMAERVDLYS